jgi:hypothetical protein
MEEVESEHSQHQDDFEIEISDMDELEVADKSSKSLRQSPSPRFSPRRPRLQLIMTAGIVVLAIILILGSTAPVRELISKTLVGPTPTPLPTLGPGADLFYVEANPQWGQLSIDGHVLSHLPDIGLEPPLRLSRGKHTLVWRAEPFPVQRCTLTVPANYNTDTCRFSRTIVVDAAPLASIVMFSVSLNMLANTERVSLLEVIQAALDSKQYYETVLPGEHYALSEAAAGSGQSPCRLTPQGVACYAIATQPLKATLRFELDTDTSPNAPCSISQPCNFNGQDCRLLCESPVASDSSGWNVIAMVRFLWQYATLDGQIIAHDQADTFLTDTFLKGMANDHFVSVTITWNNSIWHASALFPDPQVFFGDPICDSAMQDAQILGNTFVINNVEIQTQSQGVSGENLAAGCLVVITPTQVQNLKPTPSTAPPLAAYCLHRFGVLLAANDLAHRLWPYLPLADVYEQHLAQQLATRVMASSISSG